jgi:hypothetical protein
MTPGREPRRRRQEPQADRMAQVTNPSHSIVLRPEKCQTAKYRPFALACSVKTSVLATCSPSAHSSRRNDGAICFIEHYQDEWTICRAGMERTWGADMIAERSRHIVAASGPHRGRIRAASGLHRGGHQARRSEARYCSTLARISARLSPPNFSIHASASVNASIASPTTPAAGTTQTSLLS